MHDVGVNVNMDVRVCPAALCVRLCNSDGVLFPAVRPGRLQFRKKGLKAVRGGNKKKASLRRSARRSVKLVSASRLAGVGKLDGTRPSSASAGAQQRATQGKKQASKAKKHHHHNAHAQGHAHKHKHKHHTSDGGGGDDAPRGRVMQGAPRKRKKRRRGVVGTSDNEHGGGGGGVGHGVDGDNSSGMDDDGDMRRGDRGGDSSSPLGGSHHLTRRTGDKYLGACVCAIVGLVPVVCACVVSCGAVNAAGCMAACLCAVHACDVRTLVHVT